MMLLQQNEEARNDIKNTPLGSQDVKSVMFEEVLTCEEELLLVVIFDIT